MIDVYHLKDLERLIGARATQASERIRFIPGSGLIDRYNRINPTVAGNPVRRVAPVFGPALNCDGTDDRLDYPGKSTTVFTQWSCIAVVNTRSTSAFRFIFGSSSTDVGGWACGLTDAGAWGTISLTLDFNTTSLTPALNTPYVVAFSQDNGTALNFVEINLNSRAVRTFTGTAAGIGGSVDGLYAIGGNATHTPNSWDGEIGFVEAANIYVPLTQLVGLANLAARMVSQRSHLNRIQRVYVVVGGGGTTYFQSVSGSLSFAGGLSKRTNKTLAGVLSSSGLLSKQVNKTLSGALSSAGALLKRIDKPLSGSLSFSGAVAAIKTALKFVDGVLSFSGALAKQTGKALSGSLSFAGGIVKRAGKVLSGAASFSGALGTVKVALKSIDGALSFSGGLARRTGKALSGVLSFSGDLSKRTGKILSGAISFAGSLAKRFPVNLSGALSFSGGIATIKSFTKALAGSLSFDGTISKRTSKLLSGSLSFVGDLAKRAGKVLAGALSFSGLLETFHQQVGAIFYDSPRRIISSIRSRIIKSKIVSRIIHSKKDQ